MSGATSVPGVLNGIFDLFTSALSGPQPDVAVYYGPMPITDPPRTFVVVGFSEDEDQSFVNGNTERYGSEAMPSEEFALACYVSTWDGDTDDLRPKVAETAVVYDLLTAAVRADRSLNGSIKSPGLAELGGFSWAMDQLEDGAAVRVAFEVRIVESVLW
jgi:hypothetical protein